MIAPLLLPGTALAVGGVFAGPAGLEPPTSSGVQVSVAPRDDRTVIVLAVHVARAAPDLAVLWPMAGIDPDSVEVIEPAWFSRVEEFTRPRVEELRCDELVEVVHWGTPPGCDSTDYVRPPPTRGEDAASSIGVEATWAEVDLYAEVLAPDAVEAWLLDRSLELPREVEERLAPHLAAGESVLALRPQTPPADDTWLPPVRFSVPPGDVTLPLTLGVDLAQTRQELHVYGVARARSGSATVTNFGRGFVEDDCVLPEDVTAADWREEALDAIDLGADLPTWVLEHAGSAATCGPCVTEPLEEYEVRDFGLDAEPEQAHLSRLRMRWDRARLDEDPIVSFSGDDAEASLRWYEHDPRLAFAFPICGVDDPPRGGETCPGLRPPEPGSGCRTAPRAGALLAAVLLIAFRRRPAVLALLSIAGVAEARERDEPDPAPRTEIHGALAVIGTDRVEPTGADGGAPGLTSPFVGVEARRSVYGFRGGTNLGVLAQLHGWTGEAATGRRDEVGFTFLEPAVGLDLRHGRLREGSPCWRGRYGASLALPTLLHRVTPGETALGVLLHGGFGAWVGRGVRRASLELRGSVLPRTDGYETVFLPEVGVRGWMFFPGTANLWLVAGIALY